MILYSHGVKSGRAEKKKKKKKKNLPETRVDGISINSKSVRSGRSTERKKTPNKGKKQLASFQQVIR